MADGELRSREPLVGRDAELAVIDGRLREADGGALVLVGEAGAGKTALLQEFAARASAAGARRLSTSGLEYETEVSFAAVDRLLVDLRAELDALPEELRLPLSVALGLGAGSAPTLPVVSTALTALLHRVAATSPVVLVVDDAHWLDASSAAALAHVARRADGSGLLLLAAVRTHEDPAGIWTDGTIPMLEVRALEPAPAEHLVRSRFPGITDPVLAAVLGEAGGLPLALVELPAQRWTAPPLPTGRPAAPQLGQRLTELFAPRVRDLPPATRETLLLAALHGEGALPVLQAATGDADVLPLLAPAERARLVGVHDRHSVVEFAHPLVRSTVVQLATPLERRRAHRALADALLHQPVRRAWHLAGATEGPDESVAAELERAGETGLGRGDAAGAVAALSRAAELSADPEARRRRLVRAAAVEADVSGDLRSAQLLLAAAGGPDEAHAPLDTTLAATTVLLNAESDVSTAQRLLRAALGRHPDPRDAGDPVLTDALHTMVVLGWFAGAPQPWPEFTAQVAALRPAPPPALRLCAGTLGDPVRQAPAVLDDVDALVASLVTETDPVETTRIAMGLVYLDRVSDCREALARVISTGRTGGGVALAINAMVSTCVADWGTGNWDEVVRLADEGAGLARRHGYRRYTGILGGYLRSLVLAARGGAESEALEAADDLVAWGTPRGVGMAVQFAAHVRALVALGAGRWDDALAAATTISPAGVLAPWTPHALWVALDVVEAATRAGRRELAVAHAEAMAGAGLPRLSPRLALVTAGATAMTAADQDAPAMFERALAVPGAARWPFEHARIQLAHGERLRRLHRPAQARVVLREALDTFDRLGATAWVARAGAALRASGQAPPRTSEPDVSALSARDWQVVRMAAAGLSNRQIGERLYLSPRTVGATLHRLFPVFGVTSRAGLGDVLASLDHRGG